MAEDWPSKSEVFGTFKTLSDRLDDLDQHVVSAATGLPTQVFAMLTGDHTLAEVNNDLPPSVAINYFGQTDPRLLVGVALFMNFEQSGLFLSSFDEPSGFYKPSTETDEWVLDREITANELVNAVFVSSSTNLFSDVFRETTCLMQVAPAAPAPFPVAATLGVKNDLNNTRSGTFYVDYVWHNQLVSLPADSGSNGLVTIQFDQDDPPFPTGVGDTILVTTNTNNSSGIYVAESGPDETVVWRFSDRLTTALTAVSQHDVKSYNSQFRGSGEALQSEKPTWWRTGYSYPNWQEIVDGPEVPFWFTANNFLQPSWVASGQVGGRYNLIDTSGDPVDVALPFPNYAFAGRVVTFLKTAGADAATLSGDIDGDVETSLTLTTGEAVTLLCDGEFWRQV